MTSMLVKKPSRSPAAFFNYYYMQEFIKRNGKIGHHKKTTILIETVI